MSNRRNAARALVWAAFAGQLAFIASWAVAGAMQDGYSNIRQGVSELAARGAANPAIVTTGMVVLGVATAALGVALLLVLPRRPASVLTALLFAGVGVASVLAATFRLDCGLSNDTCHALWKAGRLSADHDAHLWAGLAGHALLLLTPFALARALWPGTVAAAALGAGVWGVAITLIALALGGNDGAAGLVERGELAVFHLWILIVGIGVLYATRGPARRSHLIGLRPRDFFARDWEGEGELVLRPLAIGRLFAQRLQAERRATWLSERSWRIDDAARFARGHVEQRQMYCEFLADDHIRVTAGDMPDGADVWIEPGGYRVDDFRVAWPIGPLPVLVRCRDRSYLEPDGTFVNEFDVVALGIPIPLARVTFRVRPVSGEAGVRGESRELEPAPG
jgi:hypothetical protein